MSNTGAVNMTKGIIYFNQGTKCIQRMLVSIFSLRKHYDGDITVMVVGEQPHWFLKELSNLRCRVKSLPTTGEAPLVRKAALWRDTPYDLTMFIDADTIVVGKVDEYFSKIQEHGFCTGEFAGWSTRGGIISRRIRGFRKLCPEYIEPALNYGKATNTGIFGFTRDAAILPEWQELARKGAKCSRIPDEVSCQILLPKYKHWLAPIKWGVSVRMSSETHYDDMRIIHYHGRKHASTWPLCALWKQLYWEYLGTSQDLPGPMKTDMGDNKLARYLREVASKDVTVVSAVNGKYLDRFLRNYPKWMTIEGIMEYPVILFVHPDALYDSRLYKVRKNVQVIPWSLPEAESMREEMLSAFVLGTARHVQSKWWIKLDADTSPKSDPAYPFGAKLVFPEKSWKDDAFTAHRWGYTRPGEFLVRLEQWASQHPSLKGTSPVFPEESYPEMEKARRYGHRRVASFISLQSRDFTRTCAELAGPRLPIPSHDTYMWYLATRMGRPVVGVNLKSGFDPRS
jgi:hypothetical protein